LRSLRGRPLRLGARREAHLPATQSPLRGRRGRGMSQRVAFCGVGALGSTAVMLCRNLPAELVLIDFDRVESKNLQSQAFVKQSVGKNKAESLKLQLANFYGIKAEAFGVRLAEGNVEALCGKADLI